MSAKIKRLRRARSIRQSFFITPARPPPIASFIRPPASSSSPPASRPRNTSTARIIPSPYRARVRDAAARRTLDIFKPYTGLSCRDRRGSLTSRHHGRAALEASSARSLTDPFVGFFALFVAPAASAIARSAANARVGMMCGGCHVPESRATGCGARGGGDGAGGRRRDGDVVERRSSRGRRTSAGRIVRMKNYVSSDYNAFLTKCWRRIVQRRPNHALALERARATPPYRPASIDKKT